MGLQKILCVGVGGFLGAVLRYIVSLASAKAFGTEFPYGTLAVNVAGGLLIGAVMEFSIATDLVPPNLRLFLVTGVLGGLTTFSAFSYETVSLVGDGSYFLAALNAGLNLFLGFGGAALGRLIVNALV